MADNYWDSDERFADDLADECDDIARLDALSEEFEQARAEFDALCEDDPIFAENWGDNYQEWFEDVYLETKTEDF